MKEIKRKVKRNIKLFFVCVLNDILTRINWGNILVCIVGDVVYGVEEAVPAEQPCLKCRCQPPGVQCETIKCSKKPGCKAIHRPNKCCPDYQCGKLVKHKLKTCPLKPIWKY